MYITQAIGPSVSDADVARDDIVEDRVPAPADWDLLIRQVTHNLDLVTFLKSLRGDVRSRSDFL